MVSGCQMRDREGRGRELTLCVCCLPVGVCLSLYVSLLVSHLLSPSRFPIYLSLSLSLSFCFSLYLSISLPLPSPSLSRSLARPHSLYLSAGWAYIDPAVACAAPAPNGEGGGEPAATFVNKDDVRQVLGQSRWIDLRY